MKFSFLVIDRVDNKYFLNILMCLLNVFILDEVIIVRGFRGIYMVRRRCLEI